MLSTSPCAEPLSPDGIKAVVQRLFPPGRVFLLWTSARPEIRRKEGMDAYTFQAAPFLNRYSSDAAFEKKTNIEWIGNRMMHLRTGLEHFYLFLESLVHRWPEGIRDRQRILIDFPRTLIKFPECHDVDRSLSELRLIWLF